MREQSKQSDNRLLWLDSLRGIGCVIVVIAHIISTVPQIGIYASGCGKIGVWMFMLTSGFLVLRGNKRFTFRDLKKYYVTRIIRIYPALLISFLIGLITGLLSSGTILDMLLFRSAWGHFWYIPVVIKFYLIAPLFLLVFSVLKERVSHSERLVSVILVIGIIGFSIAFPFSFYPENSIEIKWYFPVFLTGMLLAELEPVLTNKKRIWLDWVLLIGIIMILIETPLMREVLWGIRPSRYLQNKYLYMSLAWSLVYIGLLGGRVCSGALEKCRILQKLGSISYEVYLIHYLVLIFITNKGLFGNYFFRGIVTIVISTAGAVLISLFLQWIRNQVRQRKV